MKVSLQLEKLAKNARQSPIVEIHGGHMNVTANLDILVKNVKISTNAQMAVLVEQILIAKILMDLMNVHVKLVFTKMEIFAPI